jgi:TolB-like protein/Tfp pilus assembly protein PilF
MSFFQELKRRNVFRVGIAYAVMAWLVLQVADVLIDNMGAPDWLFPAILLLLGIGFLLALFFAWAFELTPEGIKREKDVDRSRSVTRHTGRKLDFAIIGLLVMGMGYFIYESRFMEREGPASTLGERTVETSAVEPVDSPAVAARPPDVASASARDSIAVLPFANRSLQEEDIFFTDGIHDDLLTQLAKIDDLKVVSRTSVMQYRDTQKPIPEIADELQVSTILEGGVQRAGKRIRINAQLIDVTRDEHLWAETFDREMTVENIFDIQSEITRQIVQAVRGELSEEEQARLGAAPTQNLAAYEFYLRARAFANRADYSEDNYRSAEIWARRAVEQDPEFALAWAFLVEVHGQAIWLGYDTSEERRKQAELALENARRLGGDQPNVMAAEAEFAYRIDNDFDRATELFRAAHEALPGDVNVAFRYGVAQRRTKDAALAIDTLLMALELDPNLSRVAPTAVETLVFQDRLDEAEALADQLITRFADSYDLIGHRVRIHAGLGEMQAAKTLYGALRPSEASSYALLAAEFPFWARDADLALAVWELPDLVLGSLARGFRSQREVLQGWAHLLRGDEAEGRARLQDAVRTIRELEPTGFYTDGFEQANLALAHALLGENDLALAAADAAVRIIPEERDAFFGAWMAEDRAHVLALTGRRDEALAEIERLLNTTYRFNRWQLHQDLRWDFFRDDPRFNDLVRPEGVPPGQTVLDDGAASRAGEARS